MGKTQQTLWLAGFTGLSATCMTSFLFSVAQLDDPASAPRQAEAQPHALLAAILEENDGLQRQLDRLRERNAAASAQAAAVPPSFVCPITQEVCSPAVQRKPQSALKISTPQDHGGTDGGGRRPHIRAHGD